MSEKAKKAAKKLAPREAKTWRQIEALPRDNVDTASWWVLLGGSGKPGEITITKQRSGENVEAMLTLKRRDFERIIDWYNTGKWSAR